MPYLSKFENRINLAYFLYSVVLVKLCTEGQRVSSTEEVLSSIIFETIITVIANSRLVLPKFNHVQNKPVAFTLFLNIMAKYC